MRETAVWPTCREHGAGVALGTQEQSVCLLMPDWQSPLTEGHPATAVTRVGPPRHLDTGWAQER